MKKPLNIIRAIISSSNNVKFFYSLYFSIIFLILISAELFIDSIGNIDSDSYAITSGAYIVCLTICSVTFGLSRATNNQLISDVFREAGEKILHASIMLIIATVAKYAFRHLISTNWNDPQISLSDFKEILLSPTFISLAFIFGRFIMVLCLGIALIQILRGFTILNFMLALRNPLFGRMTEVDMKHIKNLPNFSDTISSQLLEFDLRNESVFVHKNINKDEKQ